ncbi:MAG TPA: ATP-binding protein, partial [Dehalococcoidia bacterium]
SPPDAPIEISAERAGDEILVRVLDRGKGISPQETEDLFAAFYRGEGTKRLAGGMGIGLAVCKRVVEAQGCRIWAKPRDGGGSEFGFTLPAEDQE